MTELQQKAISLDALAEIERQVLWLSTAIVHHANRVRPNPGGLKVGGHQASSASMVSIMNGGAAAGAAAAGVLLGRPVLGGAGAIRPVLALALACALALGAAASAAIAGARTIAGHAPGPFGRNEPSEEVRRELVDTAAGARRGGRQPVVPGRRHRGADR